MASVNKVILIGNLGSDPEVRYTQGGQAAANFSVACNDAWTDKSGEKQERTEWVRIVAWGKTAELCGEYLQKGRQVYIEGRLQTREWTDKEDRRQYTTEVVANQVVFLGSKDGAGGGQRDERSATQSSAQRSAGGSSSSAVFPNYGTAKGKPVAGASINDLEYYANGARRSLADPAKERFHDKERALLAAIEAELAKGGGAGGGADDRGPPPGYDDASSGGGYGYGGGNPGPSGGGGAFEDDSIPF